jgi:hypothetical protein
MNALRVTTNPVDGAPTFGYRDLVRTPGGRIGAVVGFYRRDAETVLVRFSMNERTEFLTSDVVPCRRAEVQAPGWIGWN